jgi:hypothetical protein
MDTIYDGSSKMVWEDKIRDVKSLENATEFSEDCVYLDESFFYPFRGETTAEKLRKDHLPPGIYLVPGEDGESMNRIVIKPTRYEEKATYSYAKKIFPMRDAQEILERINDNELEMYNSMMNHRGGFFPPITEADDVLKRIVKTVLLTKNIDIDLLKTRFKDKNALFNLKAAIKSDKKLTISRFNQFMEAFNLDYTIIVKDSSPDSPLGAKLEPPIMIASDDIYSMESYRRREK